ncbi:MAG: hypothetical protein Q7J29_09090 [Stagnimonas sp.]|nr:hypothetical protein [Stagnimonas sp.]
MRIPLTFGFAALLLTACAQAPVQPDNPLAVKAQPAWAATHFKVGARLFPRCMDIVSTGSRVNKTRYCMTDAEIATLNDANQHGIIDFQQRVPTLNANISN